MIAIMKKTSLGLALILSALLVVAIFAALKTDTLGNLDSLFKTTAVRGDALVCTLKTDTASPPNVSIGNITGGTGNYQCNFPGEESSSFDVYSDASCAQSYPSNCTGIGNCLITASVQDIGATPKVATHCSITVGGSGIPATGCPSGFSLSGGVCIPVSSNGTSTTNTNTTSSAQLPQTSAEIGQIKFGKVFFDTTNLASSVTSSFYFSASYKMGLVNNDGTYTPQVQDLKTAKFGNKNFLFVLTGGAVNTYDLKDPFNPKYIGSVDAYSQTVKAFLPVSSARTREIFKRIEVLDNFPYGIIYGSTDGSTQQYNITLFKIDPNSGAVSYITFYDKSSNNPYGFSVGNPRFLGNDMRLFKNGSKVYLVTYAINKNYNPSTIVGASVGQYVISIFDFSNPESSVSLVYQFSRGLGPESFSTLKGMKGVKYYVTDTQGFEVLVSQGKPYLFVRGFDGSTGGTNEFAFVHSGTEWSAFFDLSNPAIPKKIIEDRTYKIFGWFDYLGSIRGLALNDITSQYIPDSSNGRFYVTSGISQGDSLMGEATIGMKSRLNLDVMDFSKAPSLSKISEVTLREKTWNINTETYTVPGPVPSIIKPLSGLIDFEYDCYYVPDAQFGYESGGKITYIADPSKELDKAKDLLVNKDKTALGNCTPTAVAMLPIDSKTFAVYRARTLYAEVDKVTLSTSSPAGNMSTSVSGTGNQIPQTTSSLTRTPFSFNSLLNIFKRIINQDR
jgi:hypothetical protein